MAATVIKQKSGFRSGKDADADFILLDIVLNIRTNPTEWELWL